MRSLPALLGLLLPAPALADSFVEIAGGIMIPVEDGDWTEYVDPGPKLGLRLASLSDKLGGMLSLDWTPLEVRSAGAFGGAFDVSAHRLRVLGSLTTAQPIASKLALSVRLGAGIDITRVHLETNVFGVRSSRTDVDSGLALEAAVGLWFNAGSVQIGGELALPLAFHSDGSDDVIDLADYSSFDVDIMFGVRFLSR
jgi:hypothetical protein